MSVRKLVTVTPRMTRVEFAEENGMGFFVVSGANQLTVSSILDPDGNDTVARGTEVWIRNSKAVDSRIVWLIDFLTAMRMAGGSVQMSLWGNEL